MIVEEWKEYKLGDLSKGKGSYGIAASAVPFSSSLHTYLRITDINDDGTLNKAGLMSVDEDNAAEYLLKPNDIVFARTGNSTGRSYFYDGSDGELVFAGFLIKFSLDEELVNPRILKYYTHSKPYYDWVRSFDTGGTRGNINAKTYAAMPIILPPRKNQDQIVPLLKSLDDKSDVGGVTLNIRSKEVLSAEFDRLMTIEGATAVMVQKMLKGTELFIGAKYELHFGHVVLCGLGGIFVEVLRDVSSGLAPLSYAEADSMIHSLRAYKMLKGTRGQQGINQRKFADIIVRLSTLLRFATEIKEIDINPLLADADDITAVDARIRIEKHDAS